MPSPQEAAAYSVIEPRNRRVHRADRSAAASAVRLARRLGMSFENYG
jgi:hypothetical protein